LFFEICIPNRSIGNDFIKPKAVGIRSITSYAQISKSAKAAKVPNWLTPRLLLAIGNYTILDCVLHEMIRGTIKTRPWSITKRLNWTEIGKEVLSRAIEESHQKQVA
jgi:hypothetical protein